MAGAAKEMFLRSFRGTFTNLLTGKVFAVAAS